MDHLSSCYFCRTALYEPYGTYRLLSSDGDGTTVTLCPDCRQKLANVLETANGPGLVALEGTASPTVTRRPESQETDREAQATEETDTQQEEDSAVTTGEEDTDGIVAESGSGQEDIDETGRETDETGGEMFETGDEAFDEADEDGDEIFAEADETAEPDESVDETEREITGDTEELREEMEPDIPDELGAGESHSETDTTVDADADDGDGTADTDSNTGTDDVSAEDVASLAGNVDTEDMEAETDDETETDELKSAMEPTDFDSLAEEAQKDEDIEDDEDTTDGTDGMETVDAGDDGADSGGVGEDEDTENQEEASESEDVDPDVQAADDIATGKKELEETLDAGEEEKLKSEMDPEVPEEFETTSVAENADDTADENGGEPTGTQANGDGQDIETPTDQESEDAPRTTVSALEYNKVMRLLQNREFPVERAEIEEVATSAYDLGEADCAEVIDLAVDRGLIDEQDGQLLRPE